MKCLNCKNEVKDTETYCSNCGKKIIKEEPCNVSDISEVSKIKKNYFKTLIIISSIFGLLEVLLVFLMDFGDIHLKVLATLGYIVSFGIIGFIFISTYESSKENKFSLIGLGVSAINFAISSIVAWEILKSEVVLKLVFSLYILLGGLILISYLCTFFSKSKVINYTKGTAIISIFAYVIITTLFIFFETLPNNEILQRAFYGFLILATLAFVISILISKMAPEENNIKRPSMIAILLLGIVLFVISIIMLFVFDVKTAVTEKDRNDKPNDSYDVDSNVNTYSYDNSYIITAEEIKVLYPNEDKDYCKIDNNGHLTGACESEKLKDYKFTSIIPIVEDIGSGGVYALSNEGEIFEIYYNFENEKTMEPFVNLFKHDFKEKIDKIGYISLRFDCSGGQAAIYNINGVEYLEPNKTLKDEQNKYGVSKLGVCSGSKDLASAIVTYDKHIMLSDNMFLKDKDTNQLIGVKYVAYDYGEQEGVEKAYVVSQDNKLYTLYDLNEYVNYSENIKNSSIKEEVDEYGSSRKTLTIILENGEKLVFRN